MRIFATLILVLAAAATGALSYHDFTLGPPVVLAAPSGPTVHAAGTTILPDGWTNASSLTFQAHAPAGTTARLDVEVVPQGQPFTGSPTATSSAAAADPALTVHMPDGRYRWQIRLHGESGVSPWIAHSGIISVDTQAPDIAHVSSPTNPDPSKLYHNSSVKLDWQSNDGGSGIEGYSYRLDSDPKGEARPDIRTNQPTITLNGLDTGHWYFHVRAIDHAGNWGPSVTFPIQIDVTPPGLAHVRFTRYYFDPQFDSLGLSFAVTRSASSIHVGVYRQSDGGLVRLYKLNGLAKGKSTTVWWNGRNSSGKPVPSGSYMVYIRAIDQYGHSSLSGWRDFVIDYRRIVVSLSQQKLWAYDGNHLLLTTLVTTGNRALPTPTGTFHVLAKFHPFTFISPWKKGSPYYYAPSKVQFALLFREGGYFIHDAPWRSAFGPGTNSQLGTPGQNYTGTHGCVNAPSDAMHTLYDWAKIGTVVQVTK